MLESFKCKESRKIWNLQFSKKLPKEIQTVARRKLVAISIANTIQDLRNPPSNNLEKLKGNRKGQYSIRINNQWRICFEWKKNNAYNIEIVDYH